MKKLTLTIIGLLFLVGCVSNKEFKQFQNTQDQINKLDQTNFKKIETYLNQVVLEKIKSLEEGVCIMEGAKRNEKGQFTPYASTISAKAKEVKS